MNSILEGFFVPNVISNTFHKMRNVGYKEDFGAIDSWMGKPILDSSLLASNSESRPQGFVSPMSVGDEGNEPGVALFQNCGSLVDEGRKSFGWTCSSRCKDSNRLDPTIL